MTGDGDDRPSWWAHNEELKRRLGIPEYEPPRFADGAYVHAVVDDLESSLGCSIRLVGYDTTYPEDWTVAVDGEDVAGIGHHRDADGNTVYEVDAATFRELVREAVSG